MEVSHMIMTCESEEDAEWFKWYLGREEGEVTYFQEELKETMEAARKAFRNGRVAFVLR